MKVLIASLILLSSCGLFPKEGSQLTYCGRIDVLTIYSKISALSCENALAVTDAAYDLLWQKAAGTLNESWQIEYVPGFINIEDPWAVTYPEQHLIKVKSERPNSIFHELGHAYMCETHSGGRSQHGKMCADKVWRKYEDEFGVTPYCHLVGLE